MRLKQSAIRFVIRETVLAFGLAWILSFLSPAALPAQSQPAETQPQRAVVVCEIGMDGVKLTYGLDTESKFEIVSCGAQVSILEQQQNDLKIRLKDGTEGFVPQNSLRIKVDGLPYLSELPKGTSFPACIYCPRPDYTDEAKKVKKLGSVFLMAVITKDGRATDLFVVRPLGYGLDQRALAAVAKWRFQPARLKGGTPTEAVIQIDVDFRTPN